MQIILPDNIHHYCNINKIQLTQQQSIILQIFCKNTSPLSAQKILLKLKEVNSKANRMTIYRALESLVKYSLIHKISYNNTYTLCQHLSDHSCQLLICQICGKQLEIHSHEVCRVLTNLATAHQFTITKQIELTGICQGCRSKIF